MKNQRGVTFIGFLFLAVVLGTVVVVAIRLFPIYLENYNARSALKSYINAPEIDRNASLHSMQRILRQSIRKRFEINDVRRAKYSDVLITQLGGNLNLALVYEVRIKLVGNIDAMIHFDDKVEIPWKQ